MWGKQTGSIVQAELILKGAEEVRIAYISSPFRGTHRHQ